MTPINFTGSFIKNITIPKLSTNGKTTSEKVSLVKLDKNDKLDVETLAKTAYSWENIKSGFTPDIYCDALKTKNYPDVDQEHYLALTTQNKNFEMVEPNKILGLALYFEKKTPANEIVWLQSNPSTNHESGVRTYKKIGTTLVDYMKGLFKKPLYVQSTDNAIPFYQKQGFKSLDTPSKMIYEI